MHPLLPDLLLIALAFGIMFLDLAVRGNTPRGYRIVFHASWLGLCAVLAALVAVAPAVETPVLILGSYRLDGFGLLMRGLFVVSALLTVLLARPYFTHGGNGHGPLAHPAEFIYLVLFSTAGSVFVVSARDLLTLFVSLEMATIPLYVLAAYDKHSAQSAEAATKYVLMGSVATAIMLFGYSYLYGITGSLRFDDIGAYLVAHPEAPLLHLSVMLILGAIAFKLAAAPFHMWAPDVYAGSPAPVVAFLSVASKATAVAFLFVLLDGPLATQRGFIRPWLLLLSALSMLAGNFGALRQTQFLRFMGYSSIAQAGYILLAFAGTPAMARAAVAYYLFLYAAANFSMFFVMAIVGEKRGELIPSLRGLSREHPGLAALLATALFALAGIPPTAGFTGKFMLFGAAAETGHYNFIIFAALNSTVSLYYYLLLMREAYITPTPDVPLAPLRVDRARLAILVLLFAATMTLGLWPGFSAAVQHLAATVP